MKRWFLGLGAMFMLFVLSLFFWVYTHVKDRHPDYQLDLIINNPQKPAQLKVGFSAFPINPTITETWTDLDGDARYDSSKGDTFEDSNGNGKFDAVWMAGFHQSRPAQAIHDTLWARTMLIDDGSTIISFTSLDAIGFGHDDVLDVRKLIANQVDVDLPIVSSTHTHEAPDLQGIWGPNRYKSGVDTAYMRYVQHQAARSIIEAYQQREVAHLRVAQDLSSATSLVTDSRQPYVLAPGLRIVEAVSADSSKTLGTLLSWGNHPETLWSRNLEITSDFPHYVRQGIEKGIVIQDSLYVQGLGGICVYMSGAIGGLMTTDPDWPINDPWLDTTYLEPTFDKAKSQGLQLANIALQALQDSSEWLQPTHIQLSAHTFEIPLDNPNFRLASVIGLLDRGYSSWMNIRTEVAAIQLGPLSIITVPGEIYPEIVNGGIEKPEGQDFDIEAVETPALRSLMPAGYQFVLGLANDQIGYIIPKSEWDENPPYLYGAERSPYGETNSVGPETAPIIYRELQSVINHLSQENISYAP